jgi:hypothetical protein
MFTSSSSSQKGSNSLFGHENHEAWLATGLTQFRICGLRAFTWRQPVRSWNRSWKRGSAPESGRERCWRENESTAVNPIISQVQVERHLCGASGTSSGPDARAGVRSWACQLLASSKRASVTIRVWWSGLEPDVGGGCPHFIQKTCKPCVQY